MKIRVADWNVRGLAHPAQQLQLLNMEKPDIILLQDVARRGRQAIHEDAHWRCAEGEPSARCLILAANDWQLAKPRTPLCLSTNRALAVTATRGRTTLTAACCYAPTNSGRGRKERGAFFDTLASWIVTAPVPLLLGMDANGPRRDDPDLDRSTWWTPAEELVLGPPAVTLDTLRLWYAEHPQALTQRARYYPHGPLADSYHRGRKGKFLRCRYDGIRVSAGIAVREVRYLYEEGVAAGSDHALVIADLELPEDA